MNTGNLVRDLLELGIVVAIGAMIIASVQRIRCGQVVAPVCSECNRNISRMYENCPHCGADQKAAPISHHSR